jgi:hypothetical protein
MAVEAELPLESLYVKDFKKYATVHINQYNMKNLKITKKHIYDFQDKLLYEHNIERILNIHPVDTPPGNPPTNTIFHIKFKN